MTWSAQKAKPDLKVGPSAWRAGKLILAGGSAALSMSPVSYWFPFLRVTGSSEFKATCSAQKAKPDPKVAGVDKTSKLSVPMRSTTESSPCGSVTTWYSSVSVTATGQLLD